MKETIHIVGGGLSGCAFAYFLKKDFNIKLYEKTDILGGLLATRFNLEGIPWQQVPGILHTNKEWIITLFNKAIALKDVDYKVAMHPLFDFRYYNYPFNKSTIDTMPWHWKESILADLETSNGEHSDNMEKMITNFYGDTVYKIFYESYFKKMFGTTKITTDWYRPYMRDVNEDLDHYTEKYIKYPVNYGYHMLFDFFTSGVEVIFNSSPTIHDFSKDDTIICTVDVTKFFPIANTHIYAYGSFDIDSTPYKENSPDTMIYPNHTPYIWLCFIVKSKKSSLFIENKSNIVVSRKHKISCPTRN